MVAAITSYALLELFVRQMLNELREDGLAKVHVSLSSLSENASKMVIFRLNQLQIVPASIVVSPSGPINSGCSQIFSRTLVRRENGQKLRR